MNKSIKTHKKISEELDYKLNDEICSEKELQNNNKSFIKNNSLFFFASMFVFTYIILIVIFNSNHSIAKEDEKKNESTGEEETIDFLDTTSLLEREEVNYNYESILESKKKVEEQKKNENNNSTTNNNLAQEIMPEVEDLKKNLKNGTFINQEKSYEENTTDGAKHTIEILLFDDLPDTVKMPTRRYFLTDHIRSIYSGTENFNQSKIGYLYELSRYTSTTYVFPKK